MKFEYIFFYKGPLYVAIRKRNIDIVELLLVQKDIDVN